MAGGTRRGVSVRRGARPRARQPRGSRDIAHHPIQRRLDDGRQGHQASGEARQDQASAFSGPKPRHYAPGIGRELITAAESSPRSRTRPATGRAPLRSSRRTVSRDRRPRRRPQASTRNAREAGTGRAGGRRSPQGACPSSPSRRARSCIAAARVADRAHTHTGDAPAPKSADGRRSSCDGQAKRRCRPRTHWPPRRGENARATPCATSARVMFVHWRVAGWTQTSSSGSREAWIHHVRSRVRSHPGAITADIPERERLRLALDRIDRALAHGDHSS